MRKSVFILLLVAIFATGAFSYYIKAFDTEIFLYTDGSYDVIENIVVDFGYEQRHGIYRNIPYKYHKGIKTNKVIITDIEVTDDEGESRQKKVKKEGDYIKIRVGSPNRTVSGTQIYMIKYRVERGMLYFDDYDELYWNVTGTEWDCSIEYASALVHLPSGMNSDDLTVHCFSGAYGSEESNCDYKISDSSVRFYTTQSLNAWEGLTLGLAMPKGHIEGPSFAKQLWWILIAIWPLFLFPIGLIWLGYLYFSKGRDPVNLSIAPRYEPPDGFSPAEAGTLVDERVDMRDMTSTIVDLAVRGYLKIVEIDKKKLVFLSTKDYALVKLREADENLKKHERLMFDGLFNKGTIEAEDLGKVIAKCPDCNGKEIITTSSLKEKFYTELPGIKESIYTSLVDDKFFPSNPERIRGKYLGWGIFMIILGFVLGFIINLFLIPVLVILGVIMMIMSRFMPRKTRDGVMKAVHVAGFEEFVRRVEQDRIKKMVREDPTVFERLLPFAMALGCADEWAEKFQDIFREAPNWYVGEPGAHYVSYAFVHNLGNAVNTVGTAMSSRPRSSGAGGGSSSFGGGGFSGGGFGGGGGGAW